MKNIIVGQSGGPTAVINSSLLGVFKTAKDRGADTVYGMVHGIKGLLDGDIVDLSQRIKTELDMDLLKRTPSSFLGSCRYKLPDIKGHEETYDKIFKILKELDICAFFYIGGNDSMDTIMRLTDYGNKIKSPIRFIGVPKTIDNDLAITDHTPGFGSAADCRNSACQRRGLRGRRRNLSSRKSFRRRQIRRTYGRKAQRKPFDSRRRFRGRKSCRRQIRLRTERSR